MIFELWSCAQAEGRVKGKQLKREHHHRRCAHARVFKGPLSSNQARACPAALTLTLSREHGRILTTSGGHRSFGQKKSSTIRTPLTNIFIQGLLQRLKCWRRESNIILYEGLASFEVERCDVYYTKILVSKVETRSVFIVYKCTSCDKHIAERGILCKMLLSSLPAAQATSRPIVLCVCVCWKWVPLDVEHHVDLASERGAAHPFKHQRPLHARRSRLLQARRWICWGGVYRLARTQAAREFAPPSTPFPYLSLEPPLLSLPIPPSLFHPHSPTPPLEISLPLSRSLLFYFYAPQTLLTLSDILNL